VGKIIISPSILSADFANLERDIKRVEEAGADWLHIDVMDGHFVPNITIGMPVAASIKKVAKIPLDVHIMIENPREYAEPFAKAGADILTFHYEAVEAVEIPELVKYIKSLDMKAGMAIKPKTPAEKILEYLPLLDMLLVMTVEPGFGGQKFMEDCAQKIKTIRRHSKEIIIQVDGGINAETGRLCCEYGANSLVAGSYIYGAADINSVIKQLNQL